MKWYFRFARELGDNKVLFHVNQAFCWYNDRKLTLNTAAVSGQCGTFHWESTKKNEEENSMNEIDRESITGSQ